VSGRLRLRRGVVVGEDPLTVEIDGERRPAWADTALLGEMREGDDVVVNVAAVELGLGSGGFDVVHVNLTRGLEAGPGEVGAGDEEPPHVMKLNYTSIQHPVDPVEAADADGLRRFSHLTGGKSAASTVVLVLPLHGHLAPAAWAIAQSVDGGGGDDSCGERDAHGGEGLVVGYMQTGGGALPGSLSRDVRELHERGLLAGHMTVAPAYGGEGEAISVCGALDAARRLGWDVALVGPGPGIIGSDSEFGHGGMAALDSAHGALSLGLPTTLSPRLSSADPRERHRGLSHHTRTVLELLLAPVTVATPEGAERWPGGIEAEESLRSVAGDRHPVVTERVYMDDYLESGLPTRTMGRSLDEDPLFFAAPLAAGAALRDAAGAALRRKG
jgi:Protein of unknown function (DUF3866)